MIDEDVVEPISPNNTINMDVKHARAIGAHVFYHRLWRPLGVAKPIPESQMRKLKIIEHISLDSVIQNSVDDDDFPYGDRKAPYRTPESRYAILAAHGESFDLLLGRRTCDIWSGY